MFEIGDRVKLKKQGDFTVKEGFVNGRNGAKLKIIWNDGTSFWIKNRYLERVSEES